MPTEIQGMLQGVGGSFDYTTIFVGIAFSIVGWGAWRYGRKIQSGRHMLLGVALMGYAYFVPNPWWSFVVGSLLTGFLFWP